MQVLDDHVGRDQAAAQEHRDGKIDHIGCSSAELRRRTGKRISGQHDENHVESRTDNNSSSGDSHRMEEIFFLDQVLISGK